MFWYVVLHNSKRFKTADSLQGVLPRDVVGVLALTAPGSRDVQVWPAASML